MRSKKWRKKEVMKKWETYSGLEANKVRFKTKDKERKRGVAPAKAEDEV